MSGRGAAAGPGANSRGRGGKFKKFTRGGGKHFSRDLGPRDDDGFQVSIWSQTPKEDEDSESGSEDDSEEDSEEDSDDDLGGVSGAGPSQGQELTREERKAAKKAQKDAAIARRQKGQVQVGDLPSESEESEDEDDDMPANPNHSKAARQQTKLPAPDVAAAAEGVKKMSLKKESQKKEPPAVFENKRLQTQAMNDKIKSDMERLARIRQEREDAARKKEAEREDLEERKQEKAKALEAKEAARREKALGKPAPKKGKK